MCVNISLIYLFINFMGVRVLNARKFPTLPIFPSYIENQNQHKCQLIVDMLMLEWFHFILFSEKKKKKRFGK